MTANDYREFTERLKRDYPDESFLVLRFGDHQPAISQKLLEPGIDQARLAKRLMAADPRYLLDLLCDRRHQLLARQPVVRA